MRQRTRTLLTVVVLLGLAVVAVLYWTQDSSPVDLLRSLHGQSAGHGS